jgi:hypothetical protein
MMKPIMFEKQPSQQRHWKKRRRSQRLILRVPHCRLQTQKLGSRFAEGTHTLVVNARGALINLATKVAADERLFLKGAQTGDEQECRIVFTRGNSTIGPTEVGVEFQQPASHLKPVKQERWSGAEHGSIGESWLWEL